MYLYVCVHICVCLYRWVPTNVHICVPVRMGAYECAHFSKHVRGCVHAYKPYTRGKLHINTDMRGTAHSPYRETDRTAWHSFLNLLLLHSVSWALVWLQRRESAVLLFSCARTPPTAPPNLPLGVIALKGPSQEGTDLLKTEMGVAVTASLSHLRVYFFWFFFYWIKKWKGLWFAFFLFS